MLRFRDLGVFVFEFWVLRFRDLGVFVFDLGYLVFEIWVLRFRDLGASCFGLRFRVLRFRNYQVLIPFYKAFVRPHPGVRSVGMGLDCDILIKVGI